jgi:fatty acid desaturase
MGAMLSTLVSQPTLELNDPELLGRINELRKTDNVTNWFYLAREYLFLAAVLGGCIVLVNWLIDSGLSLWWALPEVFLANLLVGAGQHRLATLTHEASHYMLFRNRLLNELVSEWFCMYPLLAATHPYRVQHLGHHQYPNDPERDPDITQLRMSGHRYRFPMTRWRFIWECVIKQYFWIPNPIKYVLARARYKVDIGDTGPYKLKCKGSPIMPALAAGYLCVLIGVTAAGVWWELPWLLTAVPVIMLAGLLAFYFMAPERLFLQFSIRSDLPVRVQAGMRMTFNTMLICGLAWATYLTGRPYWLYFFILWLVPLGTSFAFFMILRQLVQHGNATQDRLGNTRIFEVAWPIAASVFPIGNDYHLPHHLFPMVPHYNLRPLHALLLQAEAYRQSCTLVAGYFFPRERPPQHPTVLDIMTQ